MLNHALWVSSFTSHFLSLSLTSLSWLPPPLHACLPLLSQEKADLQRSHSKFPRTFQYHLTFCLTPKTRLLLLPLLLGTHDIQYVSHTKKHLFSFCSFHSFTSSSLSADGSLSLSLCSPGVLNLFSTPLLPGYPSPLRPLLFVLSGSNCTHTT